MRLSAALVIALVISSQTPLVAEDLQLVVVYGSQVQPADHENQVIRWLSPGDSVTVDETIWDQRPYRSLVPVAIDGTQYVVDSWHVTDPFDEPLPASTVTDVVNDTPMYSVSLTVFGKPSVVPTNEVPAGTTAALYDLFIDDVDTYVFAIANGHHGWISASAARFENQPVEDEALGEMFVRNGPSLEIPSRNITLVDRYLGQRYTALGGVNGRWAYYKSVTDDSATYVAVDTTSNGSVAARGPLLSSPDGRYFAAVETRVLDTDPIVINVFDVSDPGNLQKVFDGRSDIRSEVNGRRGRARLASSGWTTETTFETVLSIDGAESSIRVEQQQGRWRWSSTDHVYSQLLD